eukprot:scaffold126494_cov30-Tisochrysis_lutea.AAC.1
MARWNWRRVSGVQRVFEPETRAQSDSKSSSAFIERPSAARNFRCTSSGLAPMHGSVVVNSLRLRSRCQLFSAHPRTSSTSLTDA